MPHPDLTPPDHVTAPNHTPADHTSDIAARYRVLMMLAILLTMFTLAVVANAEPTHEETDTPVTPQPVITPDTHPAVTRDVAVDINELLRHQNPRPVWTEFVQTAGTHPVRPDRLTLIIGVDQPAIIQFDIDPHNQTLRRVANQSIRPDSAITKRPAPARVPRVARVARTPIVVADAADR